MNFKSLLSKTIIYLIYFLSKRLLTSGFMEQVERFVQMVNNESLTGEQKRELVKQKIKELGDFTFTNMPDRMLNLAIEIAVAQFYDYLEQRKDEK